MPLDRPDFELHGTRTGRIRCDKPNYSNPPKSDPRPDSIFKPEDVGAVGVQMGGKTLLGMHAALAAKANVTFADFDRVPDCPLLRPESREGIIMRMPLHQTPLCQVPAFRKAVDREFSGKRVTATQIKEHRKANADFIEKFLPGRHD